MGCTTARSFRVRVGISPPIPVFVRVQQTLSASTGKAYQWFKDEIAIAGDTNKTLQLQGNYNGNYRVGVMNGDSCWNYSFPLSISDIVSVQEETQGWLIYPNPVSSDLYVRTIEPPAQAVAELRNALGESIATIDMNKISGEGHLDMADFPPGMYLLRISEPGRQQLYKIIKQ